MSDRDDDEDDEEMQAQWNEAGVSVIHEFRSGGDAGGGGGGAAGAGDADSVTTVVYEYCTDSDVPVADEELAPALPADDSAVGAYAPDAASTQEPTAALQSRVRVPWTGRPNVSVWLTNEATTRFGIGHPTNTGAAPLHIVAHDAQGHNVGGITLAPGEHVDWYHPPASAVSVGVAHGYVEPGPDTELTYDTPIY